GLLRRNQQANHFTYSNAVVNLPLVLKDSSVLVFGPGIEKWDIKSAALQSVPSVLKGLSVQLAFIKPLAHNWTATFLFLPRWNGSETYSFKNKLLPAGAVLASRKLSADFTYKFGVYYHNEYYGNIFIPLFGLDWKINPTLSLFGILPGSLTLEKKVTPAFYYGAAFRALTASYEYADSKNFIRIDENQLQAFADVYLAKHVVLNAEVGHSVLRRFRTGNIHGSPKYELTDKFQDNMLLRVGLAYRVRFD
ncbi:MAG TPA: DUF6268 family outer membrane beta-barrel protein, partial [Chitinophagaceae bacterium]|nr:DUF6268 family outer membrane beta-barrel protein [Chitinophagaceae bacterium]